MPDLIETTVRDRTLYLAMNRPEKRNALNAALVRRLGAALREAEADDAIRVVVLEGNGPAFSAGADLASLRALRSASPMAHRDDSRRLADLFLQIYRLSKPVIAKVHGPAIAGGCGLAAVCDLSVVARGASLGFTEVRIGFVPAIVMVFLRRKIGEAAARNVLLRGALIEADTAVRMGLVTQAVASDAVQNTVHDWARELATETSASAVALTKQMLAQMPGMGLHEALDYAVQMNAFARGTDDCQAGIQAFLDREPPPWKANA
jgi:methylglutaconyl-CoA hydratase